MAIDQTEDVEIARSCIVHIRQSAGGEIDLIRWLRVTIGCDLDCLFREEVAECLILQGGLVE
jgi:hypothetical protein